MEYHSAKKVEKNRIIKLELLFENVEFLRQYVKKYINHLDIEKSSCILLHLSLLNPMYYDFQKNLPIEFEQVAGRN